jgi:hypothetical protein
MGDGEEGEKILIFDQKGARIYLIIYGRLGMGA